VGGRAHRERGSAAVEFALLASLLFMLIFGSISAGISFSRSNALQTAAREGARYGVTLPGVTSDVSNWLDSVITTTHAAALGELNDGVPGRTICVAFVEADGTASSKTLNAAGDVSAISAQSVQTQPCIVGDGLSDQRVQVAVARETEIQAVLFAIDITVSGDAVGRYERT
jgi:Flp pilus assembly protein TadG